jgi:hypothetical protein
LANWTWIPSVEDSIPNPAADSIAQFYSAGAVMVQMIPFQMPEERNPGLSEMQEIMEPLFADIALHDTGEQGGQGAHRKQETQRCGHKEERQDILQLAADVPAIKGSFMVFPVKRVEALMKKTANQAFPRRKTSMENVTVKEIFHEAPHRDACQIKSHPEQRVRAAQDEHGYDQRVRCVEGSKGIESPPCNTGLFAFVGFEGTFYGTIAC